MIRLIVAIDNKRGIAKAGIQPWYIPDDERYFTEQTQLYGGDILFGRVTYEIKNQPPKNRTTYVLADNDWNSPGVEVVHDLDQFLKSFTERDLWIGGGASVFAQTISVADQLYITSIEADFGCDQFFPAYKPDFKLLKQGPERKQNGFSFRYELWQRQVK